MKTRIITGHLMILFAVILAVFGTFLLHRLERMTNHPERLEVIFGISGGVMGFASVMCALFIYTNNFGEGFKK